MCVVSGPVNNAFSYTKLIAPLIYKIIKLKAFSPQQNHADPDLKGHQRDSPTSGQIMSAI